MTKLTLFESDIEYSTTIVFVDDDRDDFELAAHSLRHSNFENNIIWLPSGDDLIDYLTCTGAYTDTGHANPLIIFLDMQMPKMDAEATLQKLQDLRDISDLRIVLLTSVDENTLDKTTLKNLPYIQKPLDFEKIYHYIRSTRTYLFQ